MAKEIIFTAIKYTLGAMIITLTIASLWPWYLRSLETKDAARSLPSIKSAGQAIKTYEADWGKLPPSQTWVEGTKNYSEVIEDPTYLKLTGINQPNNPGWGLNGRLNLTIGEASDQSKTVRSSNFPQDAILLAPSYYNAFYPQRNGVLPTQPLSKDDKTPVQHGLRLGSRRGHEGISGLYLSLDGSVKQLSLDNAEKLLRIRPVPPSERTKIALNIEENDTVNWEPQKGIERFPNHILLKRGEVTTPLIPTKNRNVIVSFDATSETETPFTLSAQYYNEYKMPINIETKNGEPTFSVKLEQIYGGGREIITDRPISEKKDQEIGFNPSFGSAYPITKTKGESRLIKNSDQYTTRIEKVTPHFVKGTLVSPYKDFTKTWNESAPKEWKKYTKEISIKDAPEGATLIGLKIENSTYNPLLIREVKIRRE
jgi:hypothetical protein